jgi:phage shock protein C
MQKRLIKSTDKKLFGVCGGLGNYFDIDPTVIRIAFLVSFFFFGTGLLLYIILAIAIPEA